MVGGFHGVPLLLRNIQDLLSDGKTPYERRFGEPFKGPIIPLVQWSNITLFLPKTCRDCISSVRKFYLEYSSVMSCMREESGKETFWSQTLRSWKRWTHQSSSTAQSNVPGILKATSQSLSLIACAGRLAAEDSNRNDAASSSQVWQTDAKTNASAGRPAATETNQNLDLDFPASVGKPAAEGSGIVDVDSVAKQFPDICCPCPTS